MNAFNDTNKISNLTLNKTINYIDNQYIMFSNNELTKDIKFINFFPINFLANRIIYVVNLIFKVKEMQKEFSLITNIVFFLILLTLIYIRIKIVKLIVNFFKYLRKNSLKSSSEKRINKVKSMVEKYLIPTIYKFKNKKVLEFKDNKQDVIDITSKISKLANGDLNLNHIINTADSNSCLPDKSKLSGKLYIEIENSKDIKYLCSKASNYFGYSNLLHPDVYSIARSIESELIKLIIERLGGYSDSLCGCTTQSYIETLILAFRAYKSYNNLIDSNNFYKSNNLPIILVPSNCPAIYFKLAKIISIKLEFIPVDSEGKIITFELDKIINNKKKGILFKNNNFNKQILAVVAFYPNYSFGICDDIYQISEICLKYNINLHVDANYGGLLSIFKRNNNFINTCKEEKFDFSNLGVTSISLDLNKYGLAPVGISFLGYRNRDYRKNQYYLFPKFMGGVYMTPVLAGSRTSSLVVSSYMIFLSHGITYYESQSEYIMNFTAKFKEDLSNFFRNSKHSNYLKNLNVVGNPSMCIIAIISNFDNNTNALINLCKDSNKISSIKEKTIIKKNKKIDNEFNFKTNIINITKLYELMKNLKWDLEIHLKTSNNIACYSFKKKNLSSIIYRDSISIIITPNNIKDLSEQFIIDLESCVDKIIKENQDIKNNNNFINNDNNESNYIKTLRAINELNPDEQIDVLKNYTDILYCGFN